MRTEAILIYVIHNTYFLSLGIVFQPLGLRLIFGLQNFLGKTIYYHLSQIFFRLIIG